MRVAVLGAAGAALLGATLAITPLDTVDAPMRAPGPCGDGAGGMRATGFGPDAGGGTAGTGGGGAGAGCAGIDRTGAGASGGTLGRPACAAPGSGPGTGARRWVPNRVCRRPRCPGWACRASPARPLFRPGRAGSPAPGVWPTRDRLFRLPLPDLFNQAYGLVNGVVAANCRIRSARSSAASLARWASRRRGRVRPDPTDDAGVFKPAQRQRHSSDLTGAAKLVSMLAPTVGTAQLPAVNLPALRRISPPYLVSRRRHFPGWLYPRPLYPPRLWKVSGPCRRPNCRRCHRRPNYRLRRCCAGRRWASSGPAYSPGASGQHTPLSGVTAAPRRRAG